ncbi:hypothetical protein JX266_003478 [Neoarthrinium moseri]|uniref:uncharacterized protein n=1 Tax=Neoarthrinium moseri TaxID=1658444 RepID=UPI001FDBEBB3|nr:uncharacterized protein JN550_000613 [Neoarthrinium moseri]KAI1851403.1 hypothetical protein JX266_003478 [Neoarthrinium moseri]KAI1878431.1 hypothetical protein JN550_000613 [Neoarthrinium moseri]
MMFLLFALLLLTWVSAQGSQAPQGIRRVPAEITNNATALHLWHEEIYLNYTSRMRQDYRIEHSLPNGTMLSLRPEELRYFINPHGIHAEIVNNTVMHKFSNGTILNEKADPCSGGPFDLYKEYREADCKPNIPMDDHGNCQVPNGTTTNCKAFCQVRTTYTYGTEIPYASKDLHANFPEVSWCHGPGSGTNKVNDREDCTLKSTTPLKIKIPDWHYGGNEAIFDQGISSGLHYKSPPNYASPDGAGNHVSEVGPMECGYWTFLPIIKTVCGSVTEAVQSEQPSHTNDCIMSQAGDTWTLGNVCASEYVANPLSPLQVSGRWVWVKTDCFTRHAHKHGEQDVDYYREGVALPQDDLMLILEWDWQKVYCDVVLHGVSVHYWVLGRLMPDWKMGSWGRGLLDALKVNANSPTAWMFDYNYHGPGGDRFDWLAQWEYNNNQGPTVYTVLYNLGNKVPECKPH